MNFQTCQKQYQSLLTILPIRGGPAQGLQASLLSYKLLLISSFACFARRIYYGFRIGFRFLVDGWVIVPASIAPTILCIILTAVHVKTLKSYILKVAMRSFSHPALGT